MKKEYKLINPIVFGEEVIEVVKLEEPTTGKLRECNVDLSEEGLTLCEGKYRIVSACATNLIEAHTNKMKAHDLIGCFNECLSFFGRSPIREEKEEASD